jgi:E3 ubiquitin-protein ligase DOA10
MNTILLLCLILITAVTISYYINKEGFVDITTVSNNVLESISAKDAAIAAAAKAMDAKAMADKRVLEAIAAVDKAKAAAANASKKAGELMLNSTVSQVDKDNAVAAVTAANKAADEAVAAKVAATAAAAAAAAALTAAEADKVAAIATVSAVSKQANRAIADKIESDKHAVTAVAASSVTGGTPSRTDIVPEIGISENGQNAKILQKKSDLLKDIQKIVRNEILANRNTTPIMNDEATCQDDNECENTTATSQGKEYSSRCHKDKSCSQQPDMAQYIKKDSIPCWGCSLDY